MTPRPALFLLTAALLVPGSPVHGQAPGDTSACELRLQPERVPVQESAALVTVRATADPGALRGIELAPRSGVAVLKAAPARDREEVVARVALDTSEARPGRWRVVLRGGAADCQGTIAVAPRGAAEGGG